MIDPVDSVRQLAARKYRRNWSAWAQGGLEAFPMAFRIHGVDSKDSATDMRAAATVARRWLDYIGPGTVQLASRRWPGMGVQHVPYRLVLETPAEVAGLIGQDKHWSKASQRAEVLHSDWARLEMIPAGIMDRIVELPGDDWGKLAVALRWADTADVEGLLTRQLEIPGADTKWADRFWPLVEELSALGARTSEGLMVSLRKIEKMTTIAVLDPELRAVVGGLRVFAAAPSELIGLKLAPATVILCENLQNVHMFTDIPGAVVLAGKGFDVVAHSVIPWVASGRILYWGDIDTNGFAILHRLRVHLPDAESILMDVDTLLAGHGSWAEEKKQAIGSFRKLNEAERDLHRALVDGDYGRNVRFEQERVPVSAVVAALRAAGVAA